MLEEADARFINFEPIGVWHCHSLADKPYRPLEGDPNPQFNHIEVELSFAFGQRFWGNGYATEASKAMIGYAFNELKLPRLVGGANLPNEKS